MISTQIYKYARQTADGFISIDAGRLISVLLFGGSDATSAKFYNIGTVILDVNVPANDSREIDMSCLGGIGNSALFLDITGTNAVALVAFDGQKAVHSAVTSGQTLVVGDNNKGYTITSGTSTHRLPAHSTLSAGYVVAFWNQSAGDNTILVPVAELGGGLVWNNAESPADGVILNQNEAVLFKWNGSRWIATGTGAATTV